MTELARFNLNQYQTQILLKLESRPAGTYLINMQVEGNSLLSSVFVESADVGATVEVKYYDTTTGSNVGERFDLSDSHPPIGNADVPITDRRLISKIHNKPICEVIVSGGNVTFGVYVTVVQSFATDLDAALQSDNQIADLGVDKGMPMMCYDEATNKFFNGIRNRASIIPIELEILTDDDIYFEVRIQALTTGGTYTSVDADSAVEYSTNFTGITNGYVVDSGYAAGANNRSSGLARTFETNTLISQIPYTNDQEAVVIRAKRLTQNANAYASISWREIY